MTVWQDGSLQACWSANTDCIKQTAPDETSIRRRTAFMKLPTLMSYDIIAEGNTDNSITTITGEILPSRRGYKHVYASKDSDENLDKTVTNTFIHRVAKLQMKIRMGKALIICAR